MNYSCVIVDDEQHAIDLLHDYIKEIDFLTLSMSFNAPLSAMDTISGEDHIDFLFLDVDMVGMNGIELAKHLRPMARFIIYTSANLEDDILEIGGAYEAYIGKPISMRRFKRVVIELLKMDYLI